MRSHLKLLDCIPAGITNRKKIFKKKKQINEPGMKQQRSWKEAEQQWNSLKQFISNKRAEVKQVYVFCTADGPVNKA